MTRVVIVYHSGYGHTEAQAKAVNSGAASVVDVSSKLIKVEDIDNNWPELENADAIIFGAPTYMGSASAKFKEFADKTSKFWMKQKFKDKIAAGFTNSGSQSGDKLSTLIQMSILAAQHGMIWVGLDLLPGNNSSKGSVEDLNRIGSYLGAMAQSNVDEGPDKGPIKSDLLTAEKLGERVAKAAARWKKGGN